MRERAGLNAVNGWRHQGEGHGHALKFFVLQEDHRAVRNFLFGQGTLGFDLASNLARLEALNRSRDTGEMVLAPDGDAAGRKAANKLAARATSTGWRAVSHSDALLCLDAGLEHGFEKLSWCHF